MFKLFIICSLVCSIFAAATPEDAQATIVKYNNEINEDGSYNWDYATSNNIQAQETGVGAEQAAGSYSYTAPDGQVIQLQYTADTNGYHPTGDHLPTPPPIPDYIMRGLEYIAAHPFERIQLKKK